MGVQPFNRQIEHHPWWNTSQLTEIPVFFIFLLGTLHRGTQSVGDFLPRYSKTHNGNIADFLRSASCQVRQERIMDIQRWWEGEDKASQFSLSSYQIVAQHDLIYTLFLAFILMVVREVVYKTFKSLFFFNANFCMFFSNPKGREKYPI